MLIVDLPRRPLHLPATHHMQMKVVHRLGTLRTVIYHNPKSFCEPFLFCHKLSSVHQVTEQRLLVRPRLAELSKTISHLRNDQKMDWRLRIDISEGQAIFIFVDDCCRNILVDDLVENRRCARVRSP